MLLVWNSRAVRRAAPLAGLVYAVFAIANLVLTNIPDLGDSNQTAAEFYSSSSHRQKEIVAAYCGIAAAVLFVIFVFALYLRVRAGAPELGLLAVALGTGFAAVSIVAQAVFLAPTASVSLGFSSAKTVDPDFARQASTLADAILFAGFALAGVAVVVIAWTLKRRPGAWVGWFGLVLGALTLLGTLTFFPMVLLPVWAAVTGIALTMQHKEESTSTSV